MTAFDHPHAVRMDRNYKHQRHIYDLTRKHYLLGRSLLIERLRPPDGAHVLEIGCGTAANLVAAALRYPRASFCGADISSAMLATARAAVARHGLESRIRLRQADATQLDAQAMFGTKFDRVFFSYSLSMIPDWRQAIQTALLQVKLGGSLHIVDFGDMADMPRFARSALRLWLRLYAVSPRDDLEQTLAALAGEGGGESQFESLWRGYACYASVTRL